MILRDTDCPIGRHEVSGTLERRATEEVRTIFVHKYRDGLSVTRGAASNLQARSRYKTCGVSFALAVNVHADGVTDAVVERMLDTGFSREHERERPTRTRFR